MCVQRYACDRAFWRNPNVMHVRTNQIRQFNLQR
jgi:hypothetical protein